MAGDRIGRVEEFHEPRLLLVGLVRVDGVELGNFSGDMGLKSLGIMGT